MLQLHINRERRTIENQANITMDVEAMDPCRQAMVRGARGWRSSEKQDPASVTDPSLRNDDDCGALLSPGGNVV